MVACTASITDGEEPAIAFVYRGHFHQLVEVRPRIGPLLGHVVSTAVPHNRHNEPGKAAALHLGKQRFVQDAAVALAEFLEVNKLCKRGSRVCDGDVTLGRDSRSDIAGPIKEQGDVLRIGSRCRVAGAELIGEPLDGKDVARAARKVASPDPLQDLLRNVGSPFRRGACAALALVVGRWIAGSQHTEAEEEGQCEPSTSRSRSHHGFMSVDDGTWDAAQPSQVRRSERV